MKLRKNVFFYFAVLVFLLCVLFAMACVFHRLGEGQEYPYLLKGAWLLGILCLVFGLLIVSALWSRLRINHRLLRFQRLLNGVEYLLAALLITAGVFLRFLVIQNLPMEPDSDYKTYYEMAVLLHRGTLIEAGVGYCDYVSMFPHVFGYPQVLAWVMGIFGESLRTALLFNLVLEAGCCALVWRIARLAGGRLCGLVALAAICFLPSAILYSNFAASEPLFTFVLLLGILLFALSLKSTPAKEKHPWLCPGELIAMAVALAFGSFIRPMAVIFLVAAVICLLNGHQPLPALPRNDIPLGLRLTNKGWKRCALIAAVYFAFSSLFTMGTGYAVNRQLAGSSASYGYNLLVGLNLESYGGWNEEDANYLYAALEATGSAQEAQLACRDMALERLKTDPRALLDLFVHKFEVLWGNDDFGASWNILFMDQQGNLTPDRESFLYRMMDVSDLYYLTLLLGGLVYGLVSFRREPDVFYACLLLFCGTVALHLLVENQNRYHYHAIPLLCVMLGVAVSAGSVQVNKMIMTQLEKKRQAAVEKAAAEAHIQMIQREQEEQSRLRAEALHAQFDMGKAIREGHIRIVASQGVQEDNRTAEQSNASGEAAAAEPEKIDHAAPEAEEETPLIVEETEKEIEEAEKINPLPVFTKPISVKGDAFDEGGDNRESAKPKEEIKRKKDKKDKDVKTAKKNKDKKTDDEKKEDKADRKKDKDKKHDKDKKKKGHKKDD